MNAIHMSGPWVTEHEVKACLQALGDWYEKPYYFCEAFEAEFAKYHDRKFALMTPNCTSAIHLVLKAMGIASGDEVIAPDCTWVASVAPVDYLGAKVVFADIERESWCVSAESIESRITSKTKAIIAVDLYGNMPDWDALNEISLKYDLPILEDSAEAIGSVYKGTRAGKFGIASVFSFHRTKTLTTGEGGMLVTDDEELFRRCKFYRDHGKVEGRMYYIGEIGFKYMPSNLAAALGYAQLQRIEELVAKKRWILQSYRERLSDIADIKLNPEPPGGRNGVWCTTLLIGKSYRVTGEKLMEQMKGRGLPIRPFFYPLSSLPAFKRYNDEGRQLCPVSYDIAERGINLPSALNITGDQIDKVCTDLHDLLAAMK